MGKIGIGVESKKPWTSSGSYLSSVIIMIKVWTYLKLICEQYKHKYVVEDQSWLRKVTELKDTIWATQVVIMASSDKTLPRRLSCRSVTVAIPTPKSKTASENRTFLLQVVDKNMLATILENGINLEQGFTDFKYFDFGNIIILDCFTKISINYGNLGQGCTDFQIFWFWFLET